MGKVIKKKIQGMNWWAKSSLILTITLLVSVFMYQGWYKPRQADAAITTQTNWTNVYHSVTTPAATAASFSVTAGSNRMLVVAISSTLSASSAYSPAPTVTYGAQTMTLGSGDAIAGSASMHTYLYYLKDNAVMDGTAKTLAVTMPAVGTVVMHDIWYAVFAGVDQSATPLTNTQNLLDNTGATSEAFATALTVNAGDLAVVVANLNTRANGGVPTYALTANWTVGNSQPNDNATSDAVTFVATRVIPGANTTDTVAINPISISSRTSMNGMSMKAAVSTGNLTIANGTNPANANAGQGSTGNALNGFTMAMSSGTATVSTLTVTGDANFSATNIPTNGVKIYRDAGTIGTLDGADVLISNASTAISGNATTVTLTAAENVTTSAANYLVVVDINAGASLGNAFTATISNAAGTGIGTPVDTDTTSATLTVAAGNVLTVGQGTDPANANAPRGGSVALDSFTLGTSSGTGSVTAITVLGAGTGFTTTNIGTNGIKIYRDAGTLGVLDGADTLISASSTAISALSSTVTLTSAETVTTTPANYLVVVDIAAAATLAQTFTGTVSAVTGTGYVSTTDNDTTSATLTTAAAQTLTIANGTNPANANIKTGAAAPLDAFSLAINSGSGSVNTLTLTGSANFTTANIASAAVYVDNGVVGTYEAGTDTPVATTYGQTGLVGTITFTTPEAVTTTAKNYLVLVTATGGATIGNAFTGTVTGATGVGTVTPSDTTSATLTIIAGPVSTITLCGGCHGHPAGPNALTDNASGRSGGTFQGSHSKHVSVAADCAKCHGTAPTADNHSNGTIDIPNPLRGVTGESYGQASHAVSNAPTFSSCTTYCHSQGTSKTSNSGETRTASISTPLTTMTWGTANASGCAGCHGNPPNYTSGATTWGAAKANSHQATTHSATACTVCHSSVTGPTTVTTGHADGLYTVGNANITYTYAVTGGTCVGNASSTGCHLSGSATWGTTLGCIDCHNSVQNTSTATRAIDATVTSRPIMTAGFILAQSHTRSRASTAVTSQDCCVCHMEGVTATGTKNTAVSPNGGQYHGNGYVELRDPDTGTTIKTKTHSGTNSAEGVWSADTANDAVFVRFKRNLGITLEAETAVIPGKTITNFQVLGGIMVNHCLKCHDSNGAAAVDLSSRVTGGSAFKPFGATVAANGVNQGVLDVSSQFASTNRAQHPVLIKNNNGYTNTSGTRMLAPWNGVAKTATTTVYGPLISCWDCHAPNGSTTATTVTNTNAALVTDTHGRAKTVSTDAVELRGSVYLSSTTTAGNLCLNCHVVSGGTTLHGAGSAMQASGSNSSMTYFQNRCYFCHSGVETNAHAARPIGAGDVHGYNTTSTGAAITTGGKGYAFIRRTGLGQIVGQVGATAYTATCGNGSGICTQGMDVYTPGGKF